MRQINYILINETRSTIVVSNLNNSPVSDLRLHSIVIEAEAKWQIPGSKSRSELINKILGLRRHYPEAKILGISEIDGRYIHPSDAMNQLRFELSNLS